MKFKSEIITAASGSIGGTSYLSGKSGLMRQAKPRSTDPSSPRQRAVRASFTQLAIAWKDLLTDAQRLGWENYAKSTPVVGKFGDPLVLTGHQMFQRCNGVRISPPFSFVFNPPTKPGLIEMGPITALTFVGNPVLVVLYSNSQPWAGENGGGLVISTSRFLPIARNAHEAKLRHWGNAIGNVLLPPGSVAKPANAFGQPNIAATLGLHILIRLIAFRADGRISAEKKIYATYV